MPVITDCCAPVLSAPLDEGEAEDLAAALKVLADPARLRLLSLVASSSTGEMCACDLVEPLGRSQPTVSHHLATLVEAGLLRREKRGKWAWYAVEPERLAVLCPRAQLLRMARRLAAEWLGTALLLVAIVGSGISASRLSAGDPGLQLLESAVATGAALVAVILAVGSVSGAHLNPIITLVDRVLGGISTRGAAWYCVAQVLGAVTGVALANLMFDLPAIEVATDTRDGAGIMLAEVVAAAGLVMVVFGVARSGRSAFAPFAVGAYITGAYFFTSSTSFANPAVTVGRALTNTFAGIAPKSVPAFVGMQLVGAAVGLVIVRMLHPDVAASAREIVVPHDETPAT